MASKNPEVDARSTLKRVLSRLTPRQRVLLIADTLRDIGFPMLSMQVKEHLPYD